MKYKNIRKFHEELAETSKYSEHNKEVLDEYFRWASEECSDISDGTLEKYASRWYNLADLVDFRLDEAERDDTSSLITNINKDELKKSNGENYSASAKKKFVTIVTSFYNKFIERNRRGYAPDIDGPLLVSRLKPDVKPTQTVNKDTKPNAEDIRKIARQPDTFRNRCIILLMFSTGARISEIFPTSDKPEYLRWDDITFNRDDTMKVELRKNYKKEEPNRREVHVVIGRAMMKKLKEKQQPELDDPVFPSEDKTLFCPECGSEVSKLNDATYERRKYECKDCGWNGKTRDCRREKVPISGNQVRNNIVKPAVQSAEVTPKAKDKPIDNTPHKLFRKSRALHKQAMNWGESPLRDFFGWGMTSKAPQRYKDALKVNQKQELAKNFPHLDISIDGYFLSDELNPVECEGCGKLNSRLWDNCDECDRPLTYRGMITTEVDPDSKINQLKHKAKDRVIKEEAEDIDEVSKKLEEAMKREMEKEGVV